MGLRTNAHLPAGVRCHVFVTCSIFEGVRISPTELRRAARAVCPNGAQLLRTEQLIVDQRAGLSKKDQRAARDREGDQFHIDTPVTSRTDRGDMGAVTAEFNSELSPPEQALLLRRLSGCSV
jgi:hypothetical protein